MEYSLLQRFWLVARREEGSIAAALCDPTSNNATSQKRCNPSGKGRFALRLRCSLGRVSLRIHSLARASPQAKPALCKLYSIPPSGQVISTEPFVPWELIFLKDPDEKGLPKDGKFLAELGLTRWIHGSWHPASVRIRGGRARYVAPDYRDRRLPEAPAEVAFVEQRLGARAARPALKSAARPAAKPAPTRASLRLKRRQIPQSYSPGLLAAMTVTGVSR
jgi:hypothetical protein